MRYDPTVYKELQKIRDRIPRNTYKTILGQLRAGEIVAAAMGVKRMQRQLAKVDKERRQSMKYEVCPNCGAHLDHGERCDCQIKESGENTAQSAGQCADNQRDEKIERKSSLMPGA